MEFSFREITDLRERQPIPMKLGDVGCRHTQLFIFPEFRSYRRLLTFGVGRNNRYMPVAIKGRLNSCPMLYFIPCSKASWFSLTNSRINRAPNSVIRNIPNI